MNQLQILLVDDEAVFTKYLAPFLSRRGYSVAAVHDGSSALEKVNEGNFDLVVLDLKMPGLDGIRTLERLKTRRPDLEVIILTSNGTVDSAIECLRYGAFDYVTKPIELTDLLERITHALERRLIRSGCSCEWDRFPLSVA